MYGGYGPTLFKIEKIVGFVLFIIGLFAILKLVNVLSSDFLISTDYLIWITTVACIVFGFLLMSHNEHHRMY